MSTPASQSARDSGHTLVVRSAVAGMLGGFLAGVFGVGGGLIMVPVFTYWLHIDIKRAHAISLAAVVPIALVASIAYEQAGNVHWSSALALLAGSLIGAVFGAHYLTVIPRKVLRYLFIGLMVLTALRLLYSQQPAHVVHGFASYVFLVLSGLLAGALAGLLGIGGGLIMVPVLLLATGADALVARGTSLVVIVGTGVSGVLTHMRNDLVQWRIVGWTVLAGVPTTLLGALVSHHVSNGVTVVMFALFLLGIAALQVRESISR